MIVFILAPVPPVIALIASHNSTKHREVDKHVKPDFRKRWPDEDWLNFLFGNTLSSIKEAQGVDLIPLHTGFVGINGGSLFLLYFQQTEAFMLESMLIHSFALFWTNGGFYVGNLSSFTLKGKRHWNNIPEIGDICLILIEIEKDSRHCCSTIE